MTFFCPALGHSVPVAESITTVWWHASPQRPGQLAIRRFVNRDARYTVMIWSRRKAVYSLPPVLSTEKS
jgi:hypothetical protein